MDSIIEFKSKKIEDWEQADRYRTEHTPWKISNDPLPDDNSICIRLYVVLMAMPLPGDLLIVRLNETNTITLRIIHNNYYIHNEDVTRTYKTLQAEEET